MQGFLHVSDLLDAVRLEGVHKLAAALSTPKDFLGFRMISTRNLGAVSTRNSGMPDFVPDKDWADDPGICSEMWAAAVLAWHGAASAVACGVQLDTGPSRSHPPPQASKCDCSRFIDPWDHDSPCAGKWAGKPWPGLADIIVTLVMHVTSAR